MNKYKYETHFHTSEISPCGRVKASEGVRLYHDAGYAGIIVTDHYFEGFFETLPAVSWDRKADLFLEGYRRASEEGQKLGLDVHPGIELRFNENANDYLIYGFNESFLKEYKELYTLNLKKFRELTEGMGIIIIQAHPFRQNMIPADPSLIDGVEIYNGNPRHNSFNSLAEEYARKNGLKMLSGSDFHQPQDAARGGIVVGSRVNPGGFADVILKDRVLELIQTA